MTEISQILQLPSQESAIALAGMQEKNLTYLAQNTGANLVLRGKEIRVYGEEKFVERALKVLRSLSPYWQEGKAISRPDLLTACQALEGGKRKNISHSNERYSPKPVREKRFVPRLFDNANTLKPLKPTILLFAWGQQEQARLFWRRY